VLVSQYVTCKWVNEFAGFPNHAFVEKGPHVIEDLVAEVRRIAQAKFAFVCMPFAREFEDVYTLGIRPAIAECGFRCVRCDEIHHSSNIMTVLYNQVSTAHIVIADMTGRNPNVYYEVGYAHGRGKEVVLLVQRADDIPFDLRGLNHIVYEGRIAYLKEKLAERLKGMMARVEPARPK
jgi:nucleoside 2-deoxyribosyltransferase